VSRRHRGFKTQKKLWLAILDSLKPFVQRLSLSLSLLRFKVSADLALCDMTKKNDEKFEGETRP